MGQLTLVSWIGLVAGGTVEVSIPLTGRGQQSGTLHPEKENLVRNVAELGPER